MNRIASPLMLAAVLLLSAGCGMQSPLPVAQSLPQTQTAALRKTPLPRLQEMRLRLERALYQAPKVPEYKVAYEVVSMYEHAMPSTWRYELIETRTAVASGAISRQRVWGLFRTDLMLTKVTKTEAI